MVQSDLDKMQFATEALLVYKIYRKKGRSDDEKERP